MGMLDFDDTQSIEGEGEAKEKVEHFILNILESVEMEINEYVFSVYKHGRGGEEDDPVYSVEYERTEGKREVLIKASQELADELVSQAMEDVESYSHGNQKYVVRCEDVKARCVFTLKVNPADDEDLDDIEETPNKKGLLSMFMRHQEKIMKVAVGSVKTVLDMQQKTIKDKDETIKRMEERQIETIKLTEDLMSGAHARNIELRKIENKEKRMNEIAGMVLQGAPLLLQMVASSGNKGGGEPPQQPPVASAASDAPQPNGSAVENIVDSLLATFTEEQLMEIQKSGIFSPQQLMLLIQLAKESEAKKAQQPPPHA